MHYQGRGILVALLFAPDVNANGIPLLHPPHWMPVGAPAPQHAFYICACA